jgi:subtilase family serine protease
MQCMSRYRFAMIALFLLFVLLLSAPLFGDSLDTAPCSSLAAPRITEKVIDEVRAPLSGGVHPLARAEFDLGAVDDNLPLEHIVLMLRRSPEQELALTTHIDQMHNQRSPQFHQWLTAEQFGACYGITDADIAVVRSWLEGHGFTVDSVPEGKTLIIFSGTAAQVREAFHAEIHQLNVNGRLHIANLTAPDVPAALAPVIAGIHSLNDFFPQPLVHLRGPIRLDTKTGLWRLAEKAEDASKDNSLVTITYGGTEFLAVGPQDFYTIYDENPLLKAAKPINGAGQTLAVIEPTDINKADVTTFRSQFGLHAYPTTPNGTQGGVNWMFGIASYCSNPGIVKSAETEATLDAQWIGTTAPAAIIDFVACENTSTTSGVDLAGTYVVNHLAGSVSAISVSYGVCEAQLVTNKTGFQTNGFYKNLWQQAVAQGQTPVVAAGDSGDDTCDRGVTSSGIGETGISVNGLASTPYNVAAGGTDFSDVYSNDGTIPTPYWNSNDKSPYLSALKYNPEMAWNNTCGSIVAATFLGESAEQMCNVSEVGLTLDGGGGGISTIYALPTWQSAYGVGLASNFTSKSFRNLPDVSFFASDGSFWNHALLFCESDIAPCNYAVGADAAAMLAGGTSFVAPILTGIIGLINQAHPSGSPAQPTRQGQADYTFYALAGHEYGTPTLENTSTTSPSAYTCESNALAISTYSTVAPKCIFHNVNRTPVSGTSTCVGANNTNCLVDDNVQPCVAGTTNCFTSAGDTVGLLSASKSVFDPAFPQSAGYNAVTGLGSANVTNLVNGWTSVPSAFASTTALAASPTSITVTTKTTLTATVTATGRGSLAPPLGTVAFYAGSACSGTPLGTSVLKPASGCTTSCHSTASLSAIEGSQFGAVGTKSAIACFSGDGANDAASHGTTSITVSKAASTITVVSSKNPSTQSQSVTFTATVGPAVAPVPTGTVAFTSNGTTISGCSTVVLTASRTALCTTSALPKGTDTVKAAYSGNSNYNGSTGTVSQVVN